MKKAVIFDLDNCLAPATAVGLDLYEPAFEAVRRANRGALPPSRLQEAFADMWFHPLDWVAQRHGFSSEMRAAAWEVFLALEASRPMQGYADLPVLAELPVQRFLVTSGFRRLQQSKIRALGIERQFTAIFIDAIDEEPRIRKAGHFRHILQHYDLAPTEVLVVGDDASSEIDAGNRLGIATVQTVRPGVAVAPSASFAVRSLAELRPLLEG